jgi:ribonuclease E
MTKRMLIDASHAEETRVVVLDGNRLEDFDVETSTKKQLKGNIYLAKVVRVEPSLQAAFVEYGGNRHGFLAFSEIHPDYYQIPVADRQRLLEMQAAEEAHEEDDDLDDVPPPSARDRAEGTLVPAENGESETAEAVEGEATGAGLAAEQAPPSEAEAVPEPAEQRQDVAGRGSADPEAFEQEVTVAARPAAIAQDVVVAETAIPPQEELSATETGADTVDTVPNEDRPPPETIGGDSAEDARERRTPRFIRNYKIQDVIRRRQILLIQVVKEERGTKGAALTTYISLAGRYCVLMPNSPRGGGISRKITSIADRRRLKEITAELDIPRGMGLIVRTAGAQRPKPEIKRDCEYLLRLWDDIRETTMQSIAPALIYEEASLIKRAIRDVYSRDVDEVLVDGEEGWRAARDFMRMLMPSHAKKVIAWKDASAGQPLFARHQVEAQLDAMLSPTVQLRSGGYLVINQTEALVAIDVNSGRSTRERSIEETALRTNLEAADEVARQLRLRDLAGLIVIDFIDMESKKHNGMVERRLKEALKNDRARIQVGHISHFGLMEMSRQRLRPSLAETSFISCPHCGGTGMVRGTESAAIHVLRGIEEEGARRRAAEIMVHVAGPIAMYILNNKRERLREIEQRYNMAIRFAPDDGLLAPQMRIEKLRGQVQEEMAPPPAPPPPPRFEIEADQEDEAEDIEDESEARHAAPQPGSAQPEAAQGSRPPREGQRPEGQRPEGQSGEGGEETERKRRRRRRRRRGGRREDAESSAAQPLDLDAPQPDIGDADYEPDAEMPEQVDTEALPSSPHVAADAGAAFETGLPEASAPDTPVGDAPVGDAPIVAEPGADEPVSEAAGNDTATPDEAGEATADAEEEKGARRRGRRGGRRRRRDTDTAVIDTVELTSYTGPTPADPFGGVTYDIFDVIEQGSELSPAEESVRPLPAEEPGISTADPAPEAVAQFQPAPDSIPAEIPPPPAAQAEETPEQSNDTEASTTPPEPVVAKPVLVGGTAPPAVPKRGWWRR